MRPMESGEGCAGDGPGNSPAITPAPPPAVSPAPEPSAERAPAAGQGEGSGPPSVSGPPAGACPASEAGSEAEAPRASSFAPVHGDAQSVPSNSDASRTHFISQGSLAPQTTELGTRKAADIWKTPAAYSGQRPEVSRPERTTCIREQEEVLCPDRPLSVKEITQEDVKVMTDLLEEREWDPDTAARIDQSLVKQNGVLMEENSKLEALLGSAREEILHLRHQVSLRDDLLQLYSDSDDDEEEEREEEEEEEEEEEKQHNRPYEAPELTPLTRPELPHHCPQLEALQEQLRLLQEENGQLREEVSQLDVLEEEMLILECVQQFAEASQQMAELSEVLVLRMENYDLQQREVTQLRTQVTSLEQRCQSYGVETEKLQQQLASEKEIQMQLQDELQDLREKYMECGGMLTEDQEDGKPLRQRAPASTDSATHSTHNAPPEEPPDCQESPAEERRRSVRRIVLDPLFIMEGCELYCSDEQEQEQEQEFEAEEGSEPAEEFTLVELLVPEEDLGAIEEVVPAEDRVTEHAELVLEEAEAWEEVELELDEAAPRNVVTSNLEAGSLGLSHLDIKHVLQQLANLQDTRYRQQSRQKTPQKGECSHGASLQPTGQAADHRQADERLPNPAADAAGGQNKHGGQDHGVAAQVADQGLSKAGAGQGQPPSHGLEGRGAFWGKGLHQGQQSDQSPGVCCFPAACKGPTDNLKPLLLLPGQVPSPSPLPTLPNGTPICHQPTPCPDEPEPEVEGPSPDTLPKQAEGPPALFLQPVRRLWLLVPDRKGARSGRKVAPGQEQPRGRSTSYQTEV